MFKEFKAFICKGNIIDLAIGVVIGGAFQNIVKSLVNDIIMPAISIFTGKVDYSTLGITINGATLQYGSFITNVINFLIIALSIFIAIKVLTSLNNRVEKATKRQLEKLAKNKNINKLKNNKKLMKLKQKEEEAKSEATAKVCPFCFTEINIKATRCPNCTSELENK